MIDFKMIFGLPPKAAIAYLAAKGLQTTWAYTDMMDAAHQRQFTVAGILKLDALAAIRQSLERAMAQGLSYQAWVKSLKPELEKMGLLGRHKLLNEETGEVKTLSPWRLRTIYGTNLQSAYMAGRYEAMQAAVETHPFWQYVAILDGKTRPGHRALHGRVFRHDDPMWAAGFYPPLGYRCRCRARSLSRPAMARYGLLESTSEGKLSHHNVMLGRGMEAREAKVARLEIAPGRFVTTDAGFAHSPKDATAWLEKSRQARMPT